MKTKIMSLVLVAALAACSGGNPFEEFDTLTGDADDGTDGGTDGGTDTPDTGVDEEGEGIDRQGIPPGTASPSPDESLFRSEAPGDEDTAEAGNGRAKNIRYDGATDTFEVDDIAFDGDSPYTRGTAVSSLNSAYAVYESPPTAIDPVSGETVSQFVYRAIYGVSDRRVVAADGTVTTQPTTSFAIVRTGSYQDYGFGGFIYQRDTDVTLPNTLQATFSGKSAGLRDFNGQGDLQYTTADVTLDIDFDDFNDTGEVRGDGVKGRIFNRRVLDLVGRDITSTVAADLGEDITSIPTALFEVGPDVLDSNGDIVADIQSVLPNGEIYEEGKFYAILSGENPDEVVGVFVLKTEGGDIQSRDTGGFILYRNAAVTP